MATTTETRRDLSREFAKTDPAIARTRDQRIAALRLANRIRIRRAEVRRLVSAGKLTATEVLQGGESATEKMRVKNLLVAIPKWGPMKVDRALLHCRVAHSKTVSGLSVRQRDELVAYLEGR